MSDHQHHHNPAEHGERRRIGDMRWEFVHVVEIGDKLSDRVCDVLCFVGKYLKDRAKMDPEDKAAFESAAAKLKGMADEPKTS